jgi:hypothetical protein
VLLGRGLKGDEKHNWQEIGILKICQRIKAEGYIV